MEAAEAGYGPACLRLAQLHAKRGPGSQAYDPGRWFLAAAAKDLAEAQLIVSRMYKDGHFVERNGDLSISWLKRAAGHGLAQAQFELGMSYRRGAERNVDSAEAIRWLRMAAAQGYEEAIVALSLSSPQ
ncbi:hypothetical protein MHIMP23_07810 [Methylobacterium hispanicum]